MAEFHSGSPCQHSQTVSVAPPLQANGTMLKLWQRAKESDLHKVFLYILIIHIQQITVTLLSSVIS